MPARTVIPATVAALVLAVEAQSQITPAPGGQGGAGSVPGWNIEYQIPQGWQVARTLGRLQVLASTTEAGAIFVAPGPYTGPSEAIADLSVFYQSLGLQAYPIEQPSNTTVGGFPAVTATYASSDQTGQMVHGRFISVFTPHGTGLNMLAMTTPQQMSRLRATLEQMAATVKAQPPTVNQQAIAALAGQWVLYSGAYNPTVGSAGGSSRSHEESVAFDGVGSYQWQSTSTVSVSADMDLGGAQGASQDSDQGTYTVIGNTLITKGTKGQFAFDFVVEGGKLLAAGKTYLKQ